MDILLFFVAPSPPLPAISAGFDHPLTQYLAQPVMHQTCCPQYTICLDVTKFKPNKGQRHVLNRLDRYLNSDSSSASGKKATHRRGGKVETAVVGGVGGGAAASSSSNKSGGGGGGGSVGRGVSAEGGGRGGRGGSSVDSERVGALSECVAAAAVDALAGGAVLGLEMDAAWSSSVAAWSKVGWCA